MFLLYLRIESAQHFVINMYPYHLQPNLTVISDAVTSHAEYLNTETVVCTLPGEGLYQVAVSNNGQTTSPYQVYIIYNSYCHRCTQTGGCMTRVRDCKTGKGSVK